MTGSELVFYFLSAVAVLMAAGVVFTRNPVHAAFFLVISFLNIAGIYVLLGAEFLAAVQVIVYTGAILVVFLFVIMLVRPEDLGDLSHGSRLQSGVAWLLGIGLFLEISSVITTGIVRGQDGQITREAIAQVGGNTQALGRFLYSEYLLPFEVASLVLLVATIAAIVLGVPDRITTFAVTRNTRTISLGHPTGTDIIEQAAYLDEPAIDAPDLGQPGTRDVDRVPAGGRARVTTVGRD